MQPDPIDAELIAAATAEAAGKKDLPGLARLEYVRCAEGGALSCCASAVRRRSAVDRGTARGRRGSRLPPPWPPPRIYLGDPRRSAPEKLRTIIRHPVEPA